MDTVYITCIIHLRKGETEFYLGETYLFCVCVCDMLFTPARTSLCQVCTRCSARTFGKWTFPELRVSNSSNLPTLTLLWTILNLAGFESTQGKNINPHPRNIKTAWENSQFEALNFQNYDHDEWFFNKVKSISLYSTNQNFHKFFTDLGLTLSRSKAYGFSRP